MADYEDVNYLLSLGVIDPEFQAVRRTLQASSEI